MGTKTRRTRRNEEREAIGIDSQNCKKTVNPTNLSPYKHIFISIFSPENQVNCLFIY